MQDKAIAQAQPLPIEKFNVYNPKHLAPAYSRLVGQKRYVYPVQIREDYRKDVHDRLRDGLTWMHEHGLSPQLEGRLGNIS